MVVITSLGPPSEGIHHRQPDCLCFVNQRELGKGEMVVSESRVSWVPNNAQGKQFSLEYPHIAMHAVRYAANWAVIQTHDSDCYCNWEQDNLALKCRD